MMVKVFLIFGPSASGKSTVAGKFAQDKGFLHLEADRSDEINGIDFHNIRVEWDLFLDQRQPKPLLDTLINRAKEAGKNGVVLSLPSMIPDCELLNLARRNGLHSVILYGMAEECLTAFRKREEESGRNLPEEHWLVNNARSYIIMGFSGFASFRVSVFINGIRKDLNQIVHEITDLIK